MNDYLCVRLLDDKGHHFPKTYSLGKVDIRPGKNDSSQEIDAISDSMKDCSSTSDINLSPRIVTIVKSENIKKAYKESSLIFEEHIDCFINQPSGFVDVKITNIGYIIDLSSYTIIPITSDIYKKREFPGSVFHIMDDEFDSIDSIKLLLNYRGNSNVEILIRSSYWRRKARNEINEQFKLLFFWFAIEALCKENENDDIVPKIMLCLGLITNKYGIILNQTFLKKLMNYPDYKIMKNKISKDLWEPLKISFTHPGFA